MIAHHLLVQFTRIVCYVDSEMWMRSTFRCRQPAELTWRAGCRARQLCAHVRFVILIDELHDVLKAFEANGNVPKLSFVKGVGRSRLSLLNITVILVTMLFTIVASFIANIIIVTEIMVGHSPNSILKLRQLLKLV